MMMICKATLKMPDASFNWIVTSYNDTYTFKGENKPDTKPCTQFKAIHCKCVV